MQKVVAAYAKVVVVLRKEIVNEKKNVQVRPECTRNCTRVKHILRTAYKVHLCYTRTQGDFALMYMAAITPWRLNPTALAQADISTFKNNPLASARCPMTAPM